MPSDDFEKQCQENNKKQETILKLKNYIKSLEKELEKVKSKYYKLLEKDRDFTNLKIKSTRENQALQNQVEDLKKELEDDALLILEGSKRARRW